MGDPGLQGVPSDDWYVPREWLEILWHMLGVTRKTAGKSIPWWLDNENHRNHYCVGMEDKETVEELEAMADAGLLKRGQWINERDNRYYHATPAGIVLAVAKFGEGKA